MNTKIITALCASFTVLALSLNASLKAWFKDSKTLALKGSKMGFSETVY